MIPSILYPNSLGMETPFKANSFSKNGYIEDSNLCFPSTISIVPSSSFLNVIVGIFLPPYFIIVSINAFFRALSHTVSLWYGASWIVPFLMSLYICLMLIESDVILNPSCICSLIFSSSCCIFSSSLLFFGKFFTFPYILFSIFKFVFINI